MNAIQAAIDDFFTHEVLVLRQEEQRLADVISSLAAKAPEPGQTAAVAGALKALNLRLNSIETILDELDKAPVPLPEGFEHAPFSA